MRGYPQWNFPAFDAAAALLVRMGLEPISPAEMDRLSGFDETDPETTVTEEQYGLMMSRDYIAIALCDALALLPGWEQSEGAKLERAFAVQNGLPIFRIDATSLMPEQIVGLCGYAQSGKDSAAAALVSRGWERRAFADPIKAIALAMNPMIGDSRLADVVDHFGWEGAKRSLEVRQLLQRLGTEGGRQNIADDVWTRALFDRPHGPLLVIPDVRFEDEVEAIHRRGGIVVRIDRPGVGPANDHPSERVPPCDYVIVNDGTLDDLEAAMAVALDQYAPIIAKRRAR